MSSSDIKRLAQEMETGFDADAKLMASLDMIKLLNESGQRILPEVHQVLIRKVLIQHIRSESANVQTSAVKFLGECGTLFNANSVQFICNDVANTFFEVKTKKIRQSQEVRDRIAALKRSVADSLKTIVSAVDEKVGKVIAPELMTGLLKRLKATDPNVDNYDIEMACLGLVRDIMNRYGGFMDEKQTGTTGVIVKTLQDMLSHEDRNVRLRCADVFGSIVPYVPENEFKGLIAFLIKQASSAEPQIFVETLGHVCQHAGIRVGAYLDDIVPKLIEFAHNHEEDTMDEADDATMDLWINALAAVNSIVESCPAQVESYLSDIVELALQKISYDPLYTYEDETASMDTAEDGEAQDDWGDAGWGGDDAEDWGEEETTMDTGEEIDAPTEEEVFVNLDAADQQTSYESSWKVRRAAVNIISTVVRVRNDLLKTFFSKLINTFLSRLKERNIDVKCQILDATTLLIQGAVVFEQGSGGGSQQTTVPSQNDKPALVRQRSSFSVLSEKIPDLVEGCLKTYADNVDDRTRTAVFQALTQICIVCSGNMNSYLEQILAVTLQAVKSEGKTTTGGNTLQDAALSYLTVLFDTHADEIMLPYIVEVSETLLFVQQDETASVQNILYCLRSLAAPIGRDNTHNEQLDPVALAIFQFVKGKIQLKDVAEADKLASLEVAAAVLSEFGDKDIIPAQDLALVWDTFKDRMTNTSTRVAAVTGLAVVAQSESKLDMSYFTSLDSVTSLTEFMQMSTQGLPDASAVLLAALFQRHAAQIKPSGLKSILGQLLPFLNEQKMLITAKVIDCITVLLAVNPKKVGPVVAEKIYPPVLQLCVSSFLQEASLTSLVKFFQQCVQSHIRKLNFPQVFPALLNLVGKDTSIDAIKHVASCIAGVVSTMGTTKSAKALSQFFTDINSTQNHTAAIALYTLGEIGGTGGLSHFKGLTADLLQGFEHANLEIRLAAAYALGRVAAGEPDKMANLFTLIEQQTDAESRRLYMSALSAMLDVIAETEVSQRPSVPLKKIIGLLDVNVDAKDATTRGIVAQCFGRLAICSPDAVLTNLKTKLESKNENVRALAAIAIRNSLSPNMDYEVFGSHWAGLLTVLNDDDLEVKRQMVLTVHATIRERPNLFSRELLTLAILPALYRETQVNQALIEVVNYLAFKEKQDNGLPLRKAVFECLTTLVDYLGSMVDMRQFLASIQHGLVDVTAIQIPTYDLVVQIARRNPPAMCEQLNKVSKLVRSNVVTSIKLLNTESKGGDQVKIDGAKLSLTAFVGALLIFASLPGADQCTDFMKFHKVVLNTGSLKGIVAACKGDMN